MVSHPTRTFQGRLDRNLDRNVDRNLERILYNSSANIASLIALARLHEETVSRTIRNQSTNQNQFINLISGILEHSNLENSNLNNQEETFVPLSIENRDFFEECKYSTILIPLNTNCPISFDTFNENDDVIVIKKCNHIFKKTSLERWLERSYCCPYCRSIINS
jgi:hypothetical protein